MISGRVQGVGFRAFTNRIARELRLEGWVRNLEDGRVEAVARGTPELLTRFEEKLRQGPAYGRVDALVADNECKISEELHEFEVRKDGEQPCNISAKSSP